MKFLKRYAYLYFHYAVLNIKIMLEYRLDFIIGALSTFFMQAGGIFFVWVVFKNINHINGWTFYEIALIYGMMTLAKALNHIFFDNLWILGWGYIRRGLFDAILLQPVNPLFNVISRKIQQDGFGHFFIGLIIVFTALANLTIQINFSFIILLLFFVICGGAIFAALNLMTATLSFWITHSIMAISAVFNFHEFALYPLSIFNKFFKFILTFIIPFAFASYFPVCFFLKKEIIYAAFAAPLVAACLWYVALKFWNFGLKYYGSSGS